MPRWVLFLLYIFNVYSANLSVTDDEDIVDFLQDCFTDDQSNCPAPAYLALTTTSTGASKRKRELDQQYQLYNSLLVKHNALFQKDFKMIQWSKVNVIGWPEDVLCYSKQTWNEQDCQSLTRAMDGIRIVHRSVKPVNNNSCNTDRYELKERITELSKALFGGREVNWQRIKSLCPWLYLTTKIITKCSIDDQIELEKVAEILEKELKKMNCIPNHLSKENSGSISALRDQIQNDLFVKFNAVFGNQYQQIMWHMVKVTGWPKEVISYYSGNWNIDDCAILQNALPGINFSVKSEPSTTNVSRKQKEALKMRIEGLSAALLGKGDKGINWNEIKKLCPDLHLNCTNVLKLSDEDIAKLEKVAEVLQSLEQMKFETNMQEDDQLASVLGKRSHEEV